MVVVLWGEGKLSTRQPPSTLSHQNLASVGDGRRKFNSFYLSFGPLLSSTPFFNICKAQLLLRSLRTLTPPAAGAYYILISHPLLPILLHPPPTESLYTTSRPRCHPTRLINISRVLPPKERVFAFISRLQLGQFPLQQPHLHPHHTSHT